MRLRYDPPQDNYVINLAPRVYGVGDYVGEYGYALCMTRFNIRVLWDDGGVVDVNPTDIVFYVDGGRSA